MFKMRPKLTQEEIYFNNKFKNYHRTKAKNKGCKSVHGNRECERRRRQIERGQLTASNGLDLSYIPQYIFKNDYKPQETITVD